MNTLPEQQVNYTNNAATPYTSACNIAHDGVDVHGSAHTVNQVNTADTAAALTPAVIRQQMRNRVRATIVGHDQDTVASADSYFTPQSLTWQHLRDPSSLIAGIRALLMQTSHPKIAAGVHQHSTYHTDPLSRLHRTVDYMATITYADRDTVNTTIDTIRNVHEHVHGHTDTGDTYHANDPELLAYVHATIIDSLTVAWQHHNPHPFTSGELDTLVNEHTEIAELVGVRNPPRNRAEIAEHLHQATLAASTHSAATTQFLTRPPLGHASKLAYQVVLRAAVWHLDEHINILNLHDWRKRNRQRDLANADRLLRWWRAFLPAVTPDIASPAHHTTARTRDDNVEVGHMTAAST